MQPQMSAFEHYEHGLVLKKVQMYLQAIDDFRKAAVDPHFSGKAHLQIALCLRSADRHDDAVMAFRQALAAGPFSAEERRHILYHMGQTLESLGRRDESVEVYGWIKKEDPNFRDVAQRIKYLSTGGRAPHSAAPGSWQGWVDEVVTRGRELTPHVTSFLEQTGQWVRRSAQSLKGHPLFEKAKDVPRRAEPPRVAQPLTARRPVQPSVRSRGIENRRHPRVPVSLRSHFSTKGRLVKGEGELRDLSLWGCRVMSSVAFPVGEDLECCIFPQDAGNPFIIDGATVRWINSREFGLSFTSVRPGVQRQIAQLCRTQTV